MGKTYNFDGLDELKNVSLAQENPVSVPEQPQQSLLKTIDQGSADFLRGGAQGATFGFADELAGAGEAGLDILRDPHKLAQLKELYRLHQQESEAKFKAAKERSPWLYGGGQLAGAIGTGILTSGAGAGVAAGAEQAAAKGLLSQIGKGVALGTGYGALQGAGDSEGNLDNTRNAGKLAKDVIGGAATGGVLGGGLSAVTGGIGKGIKLLGNKGKNYLEDSPLLRQIAKAYRQGEEGIKINQGEASRAQIARQQINDISTLTNKVLSGEEVIGKEMGDLLENASKEGVKLTFDPNTIRDAESVQKFLKSHPFYSDSPQFLGLLNKLEKLTSGEVASTGDTAVTMLPVSNLDPIEAFNLRKEIFNLAKKEKIPGLQNIANSIGEDIQGKLQEAVPGLDQYSSMFKQLREAGSETLLGKGKPSDVFFGDLKGGKVKLGRSIDEMLQFLTTPGQYGTGAKRAFTEFIDNMKALETQHPGLMEKLGFGSVDALEKEIISKADNFAIARQALGYDPQSSAFNNIKNTILGGGSSTGRGKLILGANTLGKVKKFVNPVLDMGHNLFSAPEDTLYQVAASLRDAGMGSVGEALERGLKDKNASLKNAALFSILQNPDARHAIWKDKLDHE